MEHMRERLERERDVAIGRLRELGISPIWTTKRLLTPAPIPSGTKATSLRPASGRT